MTDVRSKLSELIAKSRVRDIRTPEQIIIDQQQRAVAEEKNKLRLKMEEEITPKLIQACASYAPQIARKSPRLARMCLNATAFGHHFGSLEWLANMGEAFVRQGSLTNSQKRVVSDLYIKMCECFYNDNAPDFDQPPLE